MTYSQLRDEAANIYAERVSTGVDPTDAESFKRGADWAKQEFLKDAFEIFKDNVILRNTMDDVITTASLEYIDDDLKVSSMREACEYALRLSNLHKTDLDKIELKEKT